jgi:hypothetical protein
MPEYHVTDRRRRSRLITNETVSQAKQAAAESLPPSGRSFSVPGDTNPFSRLSKGAESDPVREMRLNRKANLRKSGTTPSSGGTPGMTGGNASGANISFATGRPRDPLFYWRENNLPYDVTKDSELRKIRSFCKLLYTSHPLIASCIDILTLYPIQGMYIQCEKDQQIEDFYSDLFWDQLDYHKYISDISHEVFTVGEAWPLGSFNEALGVWDDDELLSADDVEVERSPFVKDPRFLIRLPETLRKVLQERSPRWEYDTLIKNYPELQSYVAEDSLMPVSNMLLKQVKFEVDPFHKRGLPILMRSFRSVVQEEMLQAALDAIADRLYTPLILVRLGASANDLGTEVPWIPTQDDLETFEESMDAAMAGDFRVLVNHFATDIQSVFGRENMPDLSGDFERIEDRLLQSVGISRTLLNGASGGETYAADALQVQLLGEILKNHQRKLKKFFDDRARIVAEAQEHYDFDVRNGKRYVQMEEVLEVDEETGEQRIVEQPKLLVPELKFPELRLQDENSERQFREALVQAGVPVTYKQRIQGTGMDFEEMTEERKQEQIDLAIAEQETRKETYKALRDANLPIPDDLQADFQPLAQMPQAPPGTNGGGDMAVPTLGATPPDYPALAPTLLDQQAMQQGQPPAQPTMNGATMAPPPPTQNGAQVPPESSEQAAGMPTQAKLSKEARQDYDRRVRGQIRQATADNYAPPDNSEEDPDRPEHWLPTGRFSAPSHIGKRRHVHIPEDLRAEEEG